MKLKRAIGRTKSTCRTAWGFAAFALFGAAASASHANVACAGKVTYLAIDVDGQV